MLNPTDTFLFHSLTLFLSIYKFATANLWLVRDDFLVNFLLIYLERELWKVSLFILEWTDFISVNHNLIFLIWFTGEIRVNSLNI